MFRDGPPPPKSEFITTDQLFQELQTTSQKYNVHIEEHPNQWSCKTDFPTQAMQSVLDHPAQYGSLAQKLIETGTNDFSQLVGSIIRESQPSPPPTTLQLGYEPSPADIKTLSFLGERQTEEQYFAHRAMHEVGHIVMFYEMLPVLKQSFPKKSVAESLQQLQHDTAVLRYQGTPLSQLDRVTKEDGSKFYNRDSLLYEDLAEAYAIRSTSPTRWNQLQQFCRQSPEFHQIAAIIEIMYKRAHQSN